MQPKRGIYGRNFPDNLNSRLRPMRLDFIDEIPVLAPQPLAAAFSVVLGGKRRDAERTPIS